MKFNQKNNLHLVKVDISASTEAFLKTVCLMTSPRTETRGLTNSPTSMTTCSPRNWAANGD